MLYEVITDPIPELRRRARRCGRKRERDVDPGGNPDRQLPAPHRGVEIAPIDGELLSCEVEDLARCGGKSRITSYNVCYTKLLRVSLLRLMLPVL